MADARVLSDVRMALGHGETVRPIPLPLFKEPHVVFADATERFVQESIALGSKVHRVSEHAVGSTIAAICGTTADVVLADSAVTEELNVLSNLKRLGVAITPVTEIPEDETIARLAQFAIGLTGIDCAIAETGTILLTSKDKHSLLVSLLPPIHIALLRESQIKTSLHEVIEKLNTEMSAGSPTRSATFITGTSRTGDIELTLSIGVHGPKELHLIIIK